MWPFLLNKIIGCDSRTVPPLYLLNRFQGESRPLIFGKAGNGVGKATVPAGISQKTYTVPFSADCEVQSVRLSRKTGRDALIWERHGTFVFRGNLL